MEAGQVLASPRRGRAGDGAGGGILSLEGISKVYPGTVALDNVSLQVRRGEVHGIVGKNGAGKSTLVGIVSGLVRPSTGQIRINGKAYPYLTPASAKKAGVAIVPQEPEVVGECTVAENLFMPYYATRARGLAVDWRRLFAEAQAIVDRAGVGVDVRLKMKDLAIGQQQLLLILKAFYVAQADVVILDEASSSLPEKDKQTLYKMVRAKRDEGGSILYIAHAIDELLEICDRMTVLRDGRSVATVERAEIDKDGLASLIVGEPVREADGFFLSVQVASGGPGGPANGTTNGAAGSPAGGAGAVPATAAGAIPATVAVRRGPAPGAAQAAGPTGPPLLEVEGLTRWGRFEDISFQVRRGEIVGLAGLLGSGRTEILKAIAGIDRPDRGQVKMEGKVVPLQNPSQALACGIAYLPEDRDEEGLITMLDVRKNLSLSSLPRLAGGLFLRKSREYQLAEELTRRLDIKLASYDQEVNQLSGGNRQKVVVGKILATGPKVYLLDEPTKGIDISARKNLLEIIRDELAPGAAIIMSAPGLEDLVAICHRILVLYNGRIVTEFHRRDFDAEVLYKAIQGG